jgi:hypothetical protein
LACNRLLAARPEASLRALQNALFLRPPPALCTSNSNRKHRVACADGLFEKCRMAVVADNTVVQLHLGQLIGGDYCHQTPKTAERPGH